MAPPLNPSREEMLAVTMNQKLAKQGAKSRKLAEARDVNTMPDPKTYAAVMGLLGERPDEMGFSVAHPKYKEIMDVADPAFAVGTAAQIVPLVKPAGQAVRGAAKALAPKAGQMVMDAAQATGMPVYGLGVVKPEGGNWLGGNMMGNIDRSVKRLTPTNDPSANIKAMKAQLANLENQGGRQASIALLKDDIAAAEKDQAVYNWVTRNLGNYVKKEMGTPSDPVRRLADEGIVHAPHGEFVDPEAPGLWSKRNMAGFPNEGMAKSTEASNWEDLSDRAINYITAGDVQQAVKNDARGAAARKAIDAFEAELPAKFEAAMQKLGDKVEPELIEKLRASNNSRKADLIGEGDVYRRLIDEDNASKLGGKNRIRMLDTAEENPWIEKLPQSERLYSGDVSDLGFDHIIDVLRQDVREGRIRPEQLSKVSMEQAVRRTYEYDQEMAKKMEQAAASNMEGMPVHKEYPEGYKWIELAPPKELPAGYSVVKDDMTGGYRVVNASGKEAVNRPTNNLGHINVPFHKTEKEAIAEALKYDKRLEDALKAEGDTMGHCVGGYCPDVMEGRSRIYSLRDAKGNPHVTIEVNPRKIKTWDDVTAAVGKDEAAKLYDEFDRIGGYNMDNTDAAFDMFIKQKGIQAPESIRQIKGKQNAAPREAYLPYVQDFVRSGKWSDVGDFQNTGLVKKSDLIDKFTPDQLDAVGKGEYLTKGEYDDLLLNALRPEGMKRGGEVKMNKGGDAKKKVIDDFWAGMKESVPQRSELGPLDQLKQNLAAVYEGAQKVPGNLYKMAVDPIGYAKSLPAPTGEQIINAAGPSDMGFIGSYRPNLPSKPDPQVGTRYTTVDQGGLAPRTDLDFEKLKNASIKIFPWDATSRNKLVTEVSDVPLKKPVLTEGGDEYMLDLGHMNKRIAGASNEAIANRIKDRIDQASFENLALGGSGDVYGFPSRMGPGAEFFSTFPSDIAFGLLKQAKLSKQELADFTENMRNMQFEGKKGLFAGLAPVGSSKFQEQLRSGIQPGKNHPGVTPGNVRKAFMNRMSMVNNQKRIGFNIEDLQGSVIAENLKGVPKGYIGNVVAKLDPHTPLRPSNSSSYSHDFGGLYEGSMPNMPLEFALPHTYELIYREMKKEYKDATPNALRNMTIGAMEKRKEGISEMVTPRSIDAVKTYQEGLKKGEFDPNNIQQVYDYMRRKKLELKLKKGGAVQTKSGLLKVKRKK